MSNQGHWRWIYALLAIVSLPVIRMQSHIGDALDRTRSELGGLMPTDAFVLKNLDLCSPIVPISFGVLFLLSWKIAPINSAPAVALTTTVVLVATALYICCCLLVIYFHV